MNSTRAQEELKRAVLQYLRMAPAATVVPTSRIARHIGLDQTKVHATLSILESTSEVWLCHVRERGGNGFISIGWMLALEGYLGYLAGVEEPAPEGES